MNRREVLGALAGNCAAWSSGAVAAELPAAPDFGPRGRAAVLCWGPGGCWVGDGVGPLQRLGTEPASTVAPVPVTGGVWLAPESDRVQPWRHDGGRWRPGSQATLGARVHALAASGDGRWALAAHAERLSLVDARGEVVKSYDGSDLGRARRGSAQTLMALARRRSFLACWPALGEWWEISLDPEAAPIFDGLVHDYRMKEGIATPGYLGVRRVPLGLPTPSVSFADPRVSWVAGALGEAVAIVHLDVRRRIALLPIAGARPDASLLRPEATSMTWWLPAGDTLHIVDAARWTVLEHRTLPGRAQALQAVAGDVWVLVGDALRTELFAWRGAAWRRVETPARAVRALAVDPAGDRVLLADGELPRLHLLDRDGRLVHTWTLPDRTVLQGAAWVPIAA